MKCIKGNLFGNSWPHHPSWGNKNGKEGEEDGIIGKEIVNEQSDVMLNPAPLVKGVEKGTSQSQACEGLLQGNPQQDFEIRFL